MADHEPPATPRRKHLHSPEDLQRAAHSDSETDLTRHHGESNGLLVHGISFAVVSGVVLVVIVVAIAIAGAMTMM